MCGIVGMISMEKSVNWMARRKWLEKALYLDTIRGEDSTGLALVPPSKAVITYKKAIAGYDFIELRKVDKLLYDIDTYNYVIGHNRWATKGKKTAVNAHPFTHGNITLVHNGTLISFNGLKNEFDTDSEAICKAFSTIGAKETLPKLDGAYALVWYDSTDHTLHMARNNERPMNIAYSKGNKTLFYASEDWMVDGLMPTTYTIGDVEELPIGKHITFKLGSTEIEKTEEDFEIHKSVPYTKHWENDWYTPSKRTYSSQTPGEKTLLEIGYLKHEELIFSNLEITRYADKHGTIKGSTVTYNGVVDEIVCYNVELAPLEKEGKLTKDTKLVGKAERAYKNKGGYEVILIGKDIKLHIPKQLTAPKDVNTSDQHIAGPGEDLLSEKKFEELTKHGCSFCGCNIHVEDADDIDWTLQDQPICSDCAEQLFD